MPAQFVIYRTAKAAVVTLSEGIREELSHENIGVSVLCPGPVRTNIHEVAKNRPAPFDVGDALRAAERRHTAVIAAMPDNLDPALLAMLQTRQ